MNAAAPWHGMRAQDVSQDPSCQELIAREVGQFMATSSAVQEADLFSLQDRIRSKLSGETPKWVCLCSCRAPCCVPARHDLLPAGLASPLRP